MARTSPSDVAEIFDTDLDTSAGGALETWIDIASDIVDDIAAADASISADRLERIEMLVAAHLASAQDQRIEEASRESARTTFQGETGMHFEATKHGQNAIVLDPTGTLASMGAAKASIDVLDSRGLYDG